MSAKAIIARYIERNRSTLPSDSIGLRQHITAVADEAKLSITAEELDELAPLPKKQKGAKTGDLETSAEKSGDTPATEI